MSKYIQFEEKNWVSTVFESKRNLKMRTESKSIFLLFRDRQTVGFRKGKNIQER